MSLSDHDRAAMSRRESLNANERQVIDATFETLYERAKEIHVPAAGDDRAARLEAALVRFIEESRE